MTNQISIGSRVSFKNGEDTLEGIVMENCYDNVYEPILQSEHPKPKRGRKPMK